MSDVRLELECILISFNMIFSVTKHIKATADIVVLVICNSTSTSSNRAVDGMKSNAASMESPISAPINGMQNEGLPWSEAVERASKPGTHGTGLGDKSVHKHKETFEHECFLGGDRYSMNTILQIRHRD